MNDLLYIITMDYLISMHGKKKKKKKGILDTYLRTYYYSFTCLIVSVPRKFVVGFDAKKPLLHGPKNNIIVSKVNLLPF